MRRRMAGRLGHWVALAGLIVTAALGSSTLPGKAASGPILIGPYEQNMGLAFLLVLMSRAQTDLERQSRASAPPLPPAAIALDGSIPGAVVPPVSLDTAPTSAQTGAPAALLASVPAF